jgi:GR25 family glycosyltransferase involved in LPS biosynthesis
MSDTASIPDYDGYYINLDRSPDRRAQFEAELVRHNLTRAYMRFAAADGNILHVPAPSLSPGILGCWTSHYLLLKKNLENKRHLHVVEDDAIFVDCTAKVIHWAIASGYLDRCDILYTDVSIPLLNDAYKTYKALYDKLVVRDAAGKIENAQFQIVDLSKISYASTTSFLVNKNSIRKLHDLYETEIRRGPEMPIDLFIRQQSHAGVLKVGCIFPFVTSFRLERGLNSDINPHEDLRPIIAGGIGRYAFFVGCDWNLCREFLDRYIPPPEDQLTELLGRLLAHSITRHYRFY